MCFHEKAAGDYIQWVKYIHEWSISDFSAVYWCAVENVIGEIRTELKERGYIPVSFDEKWFLDGIKSQEARLYSDFLMFLKQSTTQKQVNIAEGFYVAACQSLADYAKSRRANIEELRKIFKYAIEECGMNPI